jgi:hypothetical protein
MRLLTELPDRRLGDRDRDGAQDVHLVPPAPLRRRGRPRIDTAPTGITRQCRRCGRIMDLCEWSPAYRVKPSAPCRDCASLLSMRWAAENRDRVRRNHRRWRQDHQPPRPPKPCSRKGHRVVWSKAARRWICTTCRAAHERQRGREVWQRIKADPRRLEAKRAAGRAYVRRKAERDHALRPPKVDRQQPDGRWRCVDCGQVKAEAEFYRAPSASRPEVRCRPCAAAARRARRGILQPPRPDRRQPDGTWWCAGCERNLPEESFYRTATGRPRNWCKVCHRSAARARRAARQASNDGSGCAGAP